MPAVPWRLTPQGAHACAPSASAVRALSRQESSSWTVGGAME